MGENSCRGSLRHVFNESGAVSGVNEALKDVEGVKEGIVIVERFQMKLNSVSLFHCIYTLSNL